MPRNPLTRRRQREHRHLSRPASIRLHQQRAHPESSLYDDKCPPATAPCLAVGRAESKSKADEACGMCPKGSSNLHSEARRISTKRFHRTGRAACSVSDKAPCKRSAAAHPCRPRRGCVIEPLPKGPLHSGALPRKFFSRLHAPRLREPVRQDRKSTRLNS